MHCTRVSAILALTEMGTGKWRMKLIMKVLGLKVCIGLLFFPLCSMLWFGVDGSPSKGSYALIC